MTIKEDFFFCPNCGAQNVKGANTCSDCGYVFKIESGTELPEKGKKDYKKIIMAAGATLGIILLVVLFCISNKGDGPGTILITHDSISSTPNDNDTGEDMISDDSESAEKAESITDSTSDSTPDSAEVLPLAAPQFLTEFDGEIKADNPELCLVTLSGRIRDNYGNYYSNAIGGKTTEADNAASYRLAGKYKWFFGRVILNYERRTDYHDNTFLYIYGDGRELYKSKQVRNGVELQDIKLDVSGVEWLRIQIRGCNDIRLVDAGLSNEDDPEYFSTMVKYSNERGYSPVDISELDFCNGSSAMGGLQILKGQVTDNYGNTYSGALAGTDAGAKNWVIYDIDGCGYKTISGRVILNSEYRDVQSGDTYMRIYTDNSSQAVYTSKLVTKGMVPEDFSVDISGVSKLKIEIQGCNYIRLVNCQLSK